MSLLNTIFKSLIWHLSVTRHLPYSAVPLRLTEGVVGREKADGQASLDCEIYYA